MTPTVTLARPLILAQSKDRTLVLFAKGKRPERFCIAEKISNGRPEHRVSLYREELVRICTEVGLVVMEGA